MITSRNHFSERLVRAPDSRAKLKKDFEDRNSVLLNLSLKIVVIPLLLAGSGSRSHCNEGMVVSAVLCTIEELMLKIEKLEL